MFRLLIALCASVALLAPFNTVIGTDLDDYVWAPDENYGWVEIEDHVISGRGLKEEDTWTGYTLNMTSQRWLTDADFSPESDAKSIWWHMLVVIVPNEVKWDRNATMWITGWSMTSTLPEAHDEDIALAASLAMGTGLITGCLFQIPNEKVIFASDPIQKSRGEDAIIAFTWDHFLKDPSQPEWLLRFPMIKASLRAMDAITEFTAQKFPEKNYQLDYYTVAGASKRGWTTWDVGVVDPNRAVAIIPIVLDAINFVEVEHHQWRSYGGWTWALQDYIDMNIMTRMDDPNMKLLQEQVDPYFYKERLTMPKLVVNAVLDEFQQPDDTRYWWDEMPEPKHFLMTPNAEHSMATGILEIVPAIGTWINYLLKEVVVPEFTWTISDTTGEIVATLDGEGEVAEASVWYANSCGNNTDGLNRRDFRIASADVPCACGVAQDGMCANIKSFWTREVLTEEIVDGKRTYRATREAPTDGTYTAFLIDVKYKTLEKDHSHFFLPHKLGNKILPVDKPGQLEFTTEVSVVPNTFPYDDCYGETCDGPVV